MRWFLSLPFLFLCTDWPKLLCVCFWILTKYCGVYCDLNAEHVLAYYMTTVMRVNVFFTPKDVQLCFELPHNFFFFKKNRKQRRMLHDHLRQNLRNKRNNITSNGIGSNLTSSSKGSQISNLPLQDLQHINVCCHFLILNESQQILVTVDTCI